MACSDSHPHLQNSVILAQLTLCSLNTNAPSPCSPPAPGTHPSAFCLSGGPSCKWNPIRSALGHARFTPHHVLMLHPCCIVRQDPLPLQGWTRPCSLERCPSCVPVLPSTDVWVVSTFSLPWVTLLQTRVFKYLFETLHSILSIHPERELVDYLIVLFLFFGGTATLFSTAAAPCYIPSNSASGLQFLHIPANTWDCLCFSSSHAAGVWSLWLQALWVLEGHILCCCWTECSIKGSRSCWRKTCLSASIAFLHFCIRFLFFVLFFFLFFFPVIWSIAEERVLNSPTAIVNLPISPFISVNFWVTYFVGVQCIHT